VLSSGALMSYVRSDHLPPALDGSLQYSHEHWLHFHMVGHGDIRLLVCSLDRTTLCLVVVPYKYKSIEYYCNANQLK